MKSSKPLRDPVIDQKTLHETKSYDFVELTLRTRDGGSRTRAIVRHRGAAVILPIIEQPGRSPKIVFVENDRHAIGDRLLELPAGGIDAAESPEEAAVRELREETGYEAASLYPVGWFYTTPGLTDERMHAFVATGLRHVGQALEEDEALDVRILTSTDTAALIERGELHDGKSLLLLMAAQRRGFISL